MSFLEGFKKRARRLKAETLALYLAARHPETPLYAKVLAVCVIAYAFSPIDLIPDFIPVLGYLDDLVIIPAGIYLAIKMVPPHVFAECRTKANDILHKGKKAGMIAAGVIIAIWAAVAALFLLWAYEAFSF